MTELKNVVAVLLSVVALYGVVWALTLSVRWSVGVGSAALLAACVLLLVDVEELT